MKNLDEIKTDLDKAVWRQKEMNVADVKNQISELSQEDLKSLKTFIKIQRGVAMQWEEGMFTILRGRIVHRNCSQVLNVIAEDLPD